MSRVSMLCVCALLLFSACVEPGDPTFDVPEGQGETSSQGVTLIEGSPEAVGVQAMLNHPETTFEILDIDAKLDRRAALGLIAARNGDDGIYPSGDDKPFENIEEIDRVKYVGPSALRRLVEFADSQGFLPSDDDLLGTWDGVAFTAEQAVRALDLANTAAFEVLDEDVELDKRAVNSIFAARPVPSIEALSGLYYVGGTALRRLRDFDHVPSDVPRDCQRGADDCASGLTCAGFGRNHNLGKCVDMRGSYPGEGDDCDDANTCNAGLICSGLSLGWGSGFCVRDWMEGTFHGRSIIQVPDDPQVDFTSNVRIYGQASVPMDIVVTLDVDHPRPQDLSVRLEDPNGTIGTVWRPGQGVAGISSAAVNDNISRDDTINGIWKIHVTDTRTGEKGAINAWSVYVTSRFD